MKNNKEKELNLGLDFDRIFTNVLTDQEENKYVKKYLTTFKKQLIKKKVNETHKEYYIIKQQQLVVYQNKFYDIRYANTIEHLLDADFDAKYISDKLCLPKSVIKDLLMLFPEFRKDIKFFE